MREVPNDEHAAASTSNIPADERGRVLKISAVIPTYNRSAALTRAVESVLAQSYSVQQLVVVDDGSTDDTKAAVKRVIERRRPSEPCAINYVYQKQQGPSVARNTGVEAATGDWIAFLDSDDLWLPTKLEWQVRAVEQLHGLADACLTDVLYVNNSQLNRTAFQYAALKCANDIGLLRDPAAWVAYGRHGLYLQALIVRRATAIDLGGFDPALPLSEDSDFLFRLARGRRVAYVNKPLVEIDRTPNRSDGLIERARDEVTRLRVCQYLYEKWLAMPGPLDGDVRKRIVCRLQEVHSAWSNWYLSNGQYQDARDSVRTALRYNWSQKDAGKWLLMTLGPDVARRLLGWRRAKRPADVLY